MTVLSWCAWQEGMPVHDVPSQKGDLFVKMKVPCLPACRLCMVHCLTCTCHAPFVEIMQTLH